VYPFPIPRSIPGETLGLVRAASVIVIAFLLGGVAWYVAFRSARSVLGILRWTQRSRVIFVFVGPPASALFSFFSLFSFELACAEAPTIHCSIWLLY
jgi:hypothetical protein